MDAVSGEVAISIHALRVEGDRGYDNGVVISYDFYPRPPGGGRHAISKGFILLSGISIHALRVEGDPSVTAAQWEAVAVLSTPSGWRATGTAGFYDTLPDDFYPRPPGGGRPTTGRFPTEPR